MPLDRNRTVRGAFAGAVAAGVWALQQPVDKRVFGVDYDDCELLGTAFTRGPGALPLGVGLHVLNGAAFGAAYAAAAPSLPLPAWSRGPALALTEHVLAWPLTAAVARVHPARARLPQLWGSPAAFAQATWRHFLFGAVLGELERRLNPPPADAAVDDDEDEDDTIAGNGAARPIASPLRSPGEPRPDHRCDRLRRPASGRALPLGR